MRQIILKKRYPHSREEDITDAFMRGYEKGKADRPQGEWIEIKRYWEINQWVYEIECSVCKERIKNPYEPHFCPNCGASMREREGE